MKKLIAFLFLAVALAAAPTNPVNNLVVQVNGTAQSGVLAGNGAGVATASATGAQISTALDLLGSTRGSVLYRGASAWSPLAPGTSGYVLTSNGAGADPSWTAEGHTGTVTSFSAGDLSPLFTTNVATATTTPALTFTLSNAAINTVYAGPTSGSPAPPTFRALVAADILPINLASSANGGVTGNLPVGNLNSGTSASSSTFWRGDGTWGTPAGTGVTAVSVATANGLAGSSSGGTTPALTLSTTIAGVLKGDGTAISAATSGTDYAPATTGSFVLTGNGSGGFTNTDLTYSTPTLTTPDAFNISSTGSISLTAGGAAKDVTLKSSTTGNIVANAGTITSVTAPRFQGFQVAAGTDVRTTITLDSIGTQGPFFMGRRARGSVGSPSAVQNNDTLGQFAVEGYGATQYLTARPGFAIAATETWTDSIGGARLSLTSTLSGTTTNYSGLGVDADGRVVIGYGATKTRAAWGTWGIISSFSRETGNGFTVTDSSSPTGTVTDAVFNSFSIPTINAANANVVYTDVTNVDILGDAATTGNASGTNKWGLRNRGKTRLDGNATITSTSLLNFGLTALANIGVSADTTAGILQIKSPASGTMTLSTSGSVAVTIGTNQGVTFSGVTIMSTDTLSGAGAVSVTKDTTKLTSSGVAQAITLANGVDGQIKHIIHDVDGGSMVLTPATKTGWSTATFTNAGDTLTLEYATTRGWFVLSSYGTVVAP